MGATILRHRLFNVSIAVLLILPLVAISAAVRPFGAPSGAEAATFANNAFKRTAARTDKPIVDGVVKRTWIWGPEANTGPLQESYAQAPGGVRTVQYFDKSRMEDNSWRTTTAPWDVTNGLLVSEMVSGQLQTGDTQFETRVPADVNIAGDPGQHPTYADIANLDLRSVPATPIGSPLTLWVTPSGVTGAYGTPPVTVTAAERLTVAGIDHSVASVFWDFMNSTGTVYEDGQLVTAALFQNPYYATGFPITEAYWSEVTIGRTPQTVLWQCFQRRCLTYNPRNEAGWQVEAGNVGQHYYAWRTAGDAEEPAPAPTATATATVAPTATVVVSPTATTTPKPAAPTSLQASALSATSIKLTWVDKSDNEKGFRIYNMAGTKVGQVNAGQTTFTVTGLAPWAQYCYQVAAWNDTGESAKSNVDCATTLGQPPTAPEQLNAETLSATTIKLTWTDKSNNESGFKIYNPSNVLVGQVSAGQTTYTVTGLTPNTSNCFQVVAWNDDGESTKSTVACAWTLPATPTNLLFYRQLGTLEFYLTWSIAGADPDRYELHSFTRSGEHLTWLPPFISGSDRSYNIYWPYLDGIDCYAIRATTSHGVSGYSNIACWPENITPPEPPHIWGDDRILAWSASSGAIGYLVMALDSNAPPSDYTQSQIGATTDTYFETSWDHDCYVVWAVNDGGVSGDSNRLCTADLPAAPTNPAVHVEGPTAITLTWQDNADNETNFLVWDGDRYWGVPASPGTGPVSYTFFGLEPGSYWCYQVQAANFAGFSYRTGFACAITDAE